MGIIRNIIFILAAAVTAGTAFAADGNSQGGTDSALAAAHAGGTAEKSANTVSDKTNNGREIRSFSLVGLDGVRHSLADWKGKVVVLNFWATWCSPCLSEIRDFVTYQEQYKARGLQIIGLGLDDVKKLRNVQRTLEINYPVLIADPIANRGLMERWGNSSGVLPYTVVIDREGRVTYVHRGPMERDVFDEYVMPLLDKV